MINKLIIAIYHVIENGLNDLLNLTLVLENLNKLKKVVWLLILSITLSIGFWISLEITGFFLLLAQSLAPLKAAVLLLSANFVVCVGFFFWIYRKFNTKQKTTTNIILLCKFLQKMKEQANSAK